MLKLFSKKNWGLLFLVLLSSYIIISGSSLFFIYRNNLIMTEHVLGDIVLRQKTLIKTLHDEGKSQLEIIGFYRLLKKEHYNIGQAGEFTIARKSGSNMLFLVSRADKPFLIAHDKNTLGQPMYLALQNRTGFVRGKDYLGKDVFAAYTFVPGAGLGIVAKMPVWEVNAPFYKVLYSSAILFIIFITGSLIVFLRLANPIIRATFENEKRLMSIFEKTHAGYFFIDTDGIFQKVNKAWLQLYKFSSPDEVIGKHFALVQEIDDIEGAKTFVASIMEGNPNFMTGDFSRKCNDGTLGYHSFSAHPVYKEGKCIGIEGFIIDITPLKETEKALLKAKDEAEANSIKFRSMFHTIQEGVYLHEMVYGSDGSAINYRIIDANPATEAILNIRPEDAIGKLATDLYQTSDAPFLDIYSKVAETSESKSFEVFFEPLRKYFLISVFSPSKGLFATAFLDITDSKNHENELAAQNEEYAALNEELHFANKQIEKEKAKLAESENRLKLKLEYILSPDSTLEDLLLTDFIDLELLQTIQDSFTNVTGVASIITDPNGIPITEPSNFSGVCKLVRGTEKGKANCHHSDKLIGLRAGTEKKVVYEKCHSCGFIDAGAPIVIAGKQLGIWMIGQGNIGEVDKRRMLAYAEEIGADKELMLSEYEKMPNMGIKQFEKIADFLWILAREISNLAYNNVKLAKNIEEHKAYEALIRTAKDLAERNQSMLAESNKSLEEMVYIASHDLQVPLVSMEGYATELLETYSSQFDEEGRFCLTRLQTNARRMHALVLSLLDISRLNTKKNPYELFKMNVIVDKILKDLSLTLEKRNVAFKVSKLPELYADKDRIEGVFRNLIVNSINYGATQIDIGHENDFYYVRDNGIGIPEDQLERIFRPGERLKRNDAEGVGMGLTFCRKVVEQHKGRIWAFSEGEKRGATFFIKF